MKRRNTKTATALTLALIITALEGSMDPAGAQELSEPKARQGYYLSVGAYGGLGGYRDDHGHWWAPWPSITGSLRLGQEIFPWFDLGIGVGFGSAIDEDYTTIQGHLALEAQFRPIDPLFIRIGAGFGGVDVTRKKSGLDEIIGQVGGNYTLAVGYDLFPAYKNGSGGLALTPVVGVDFKPSDPLLAVTGWVGIELTWWTGLERNQLVE